MRVCVLHRYPISLVRGTNPSFPLFLKKMVARGDEVVFVSFKETEDGFDIDGVEKQELELALNRASALDNLAKSILFVLLTPLIVRRINRKRALGLVYCDDSFPFYAFLVRKLVGVRTIMRLGDLQSAYMFADAGRIGRVVFGMLLALEKIMWT